MTVQLQPVEAKPKMADLHQHILDLCDKHGITIYAWCRRTTHCHALTDCYAIRIVPIESRILYAAALHEIGHLRGQYQDSSSSTLMRERGAWEWARINALLWTSSMENSARKAMQWYARHADGIDDHARLKRTAHHEAGHAVIVRVLGLLGGSATINPNHLFKSYGGSETCFVETIEHWRRPISEGGNKKFVRRSLACAYRAKVMEKMAGYEAERECLGTSYSLGDYVDRDDINELLPKIYPGASRVERSRHQDRLRRMTRALVRRHRDKIKRVARALLQHRTLSGRAIDALLPEIPAPATHCVELAERAATIEVVLDFLEQERKSPTDWRTYPRESVTSERRVRHRAAPLGYRLHRSRKPKGPGNAGEFMLIHKASSTVVLGAGYAATIEAVLEFIERERLKRARANQNAAGRRDSDNDQAT